MSEYSFDANTPSTRHQGLAAVMYKEFFRSADTVLNVASGKTDLQTDLMRQEIFPSVVSLDSAYSDAGTKLQGIQVAGTAQSLPFKDETFDLTICQFGYQHVKDEHKPTALSEMVRVTKKATPEKPRRFVLINPVFKPEAMVNAIEASGLQNVAAVIDHDRKQFPLDRRKEVFPTLRIHNNEQLTADVKEELFAVVSLSGALTRRRTIGEYVSRWFGGRSNF